jgi:hypothetical protein
MPIGAALGNHIAASRLLFDPEVGWRTLQRNFGSTQSTVTKYRKCRRILGLKGFGDDFGLPEHGERFAENGIDISVLPRLSDQDLKHHGRPARPSGRGTSGINRDHIDKWLF